MEDEKILSGINGDDVVTVINQLTHKTFCVSQFRGIVNTALIEMENAYAASLQSQGHPLPTEWKSSGNREYPGYDGWFESGTNCKILRLGDTQWTQGKMRIRVEVEFIPDNEDAAEQTNESALDEIRNSIELN
jgi:KGK domain